MGLGLIEQALTLNITVFPNPNNGSFTVKLSETLVGDPRMEIIDVSGRVHYSSRIQLDGDAFTWHDNLNAGVYFLRLADLYSGRVFIHKLIVN